MIHNARACLRILMLDCNTLWFMAIFSCAKLLDQVEKRIMCRSPEGILVRRFQSRAPCANYSNEHTANLAMCTALSCTIHATERLPRLVAPGRAGDVIRIAAPPGSSQMRPASAREVLWPADGESPYSTSHEIGARPDVAETSNSDVWVLGVAERSCVVFVRDPVCYRLIDEWSMYKGGRKSPRGWIAASTCGRSFQDRGTQFTM
jgi:hypothetical protein